MTRPRRTRDAGHDISPARPAPRIPLRRMYSLSLSVTSSEVADIDAADIMHLYDSHHESEIDAPADSRYTLSVLLPPRAALLLRLDIAATRIEGFHSRAVEPLVHCVGRRT